MEMQWDPALTGEPNIDANSEEAVIEDVDGLASLLRTGSADAAEHAAKQLSRAATRIAASADDAHRCGLACAHVLKRPQPLLSAAGRACCCYISNAAIRGNASVAKTCVAPLIQSAERATTWKELVAALSAVRSITQLYPMVILQSMQHMRTLVSLATQRSAGRGIASHALRTLETNPAAVALHGPEVVAKARADVLAQQQEEQANKLVSAQEQSNEYTLVEQALSASDTADDTALSTCLASILRSCASEDIIVQFGEIRGLAIACHRGMHARSLLCRSLAAECTRLLSPSIAFAHELITCGGIDCLLTLVSAGAVYPAQTSSYENTQEHMKEMDRCEFSNEGGERMSKRIAYTLFANGGEDAAAALSILLWGPWLTKYGDADPQEIRLATQSRILQNHENALHMLKKLLASGSDLAKECACNVLLILCHVAQDELLRIGVVRELSNTLFCHSGRLVRAAVSCLYSLAPNQQCQTQILECSGLHGLAKVASGSNDKMARQRATRLASWLIYGSEQRHEDLVIDSHILEPFIKELQEEGIIARDRASRVLEEGDFEVSDFSWAKESQRRRVAAARACSGLDIFELDLNDPKTVALLISEQDAEDAAGTLRGTKTSVIANTLAKLDKMHAVHILENLPAEMQAKLLGKLPKALRRELRKDPALRSAQQRDAIAIPSVSQLQPLFDADMNEQSGHITIFDQEAVQVAEEWKQMNAAELTDAILHSGANFAGSILPMLDEQTAAAALNLLGPEAAMHVLAKSPIHGRRAVLQYLSSTVQALLLQLKAVGRGGVPQEVVQDILSRKESTDELLLATADTLSAEQVTAVVSDNSVDFLRNVLARCSQSPETIATVLSNLPSEQIIRILRLLLQDDEEIKSAIIEAFGLLDVVLKDSCIRGLATEEEALPTKDGVENFSSLLCCVEKNELPQCLKSLHESPHITFRRLLNQMSVESLSHLCRQMDATQSVSLVAAYLSPEALATLLRQLGDEAATSILEHLDVDKVARALASVTDTPELFKWIILVLTANQKLELALRLGLTDGDTLSNVVEHLDKSEASNLANEVSSHCSNTAAIILTAMDNDSAADTVLDMLYMDRVGHLVSVLNDSNLSEDKAAELFCSAASSGNELSQLLPQQIGLRKSASLLAFAKEYGDVEIARLSARLLYPDQAVQAVKEHLDAYGSTDLWKAVNLISLLPHSTAAYVLENLLKRRGVTAVGRVLQALGSSMTFQIANCMNPEALSRLVHSLHSWNPEVMRGLGLENYHLASANADEGEQQPIQMVETHHSEPEEVYANEDADVVENGDAIDSEDIPSPKEAKPVSDTSKSASATSSQVSAGGVEDDTSNVDASLYACERESSGGHETHTLAMLPDEKISGQAYITMEPALDTDLWSSQKRNAGDEEVSVQPSVSGTALHDSEHLIEQQIDKQLRQTQNFHSANSPSKSSSSFLKPLAADSRRENHKATSRVQRLQSLQAEGGGQLRKPRPYVDISTESTSRWEMLRQKMSPNRQRERYGWNEASELEQYLLVGWDDEKQEDKAAKIHHHHYHHRKAAGISAQGLEPEEVLWTAKAQPASVGVLLDAMGKGGQLKLARVLQRGHGDDMLSSMRCDSAARLLLLLDVKQRARRLEMLPGEQRAAVEHSMRHTFGHHAVPSIDRSLSTLSDGQLWSQSLRSCVEMLKQCMPTASSAISSLLSSSRRWRVPSAVACALGALFFPQQLQRHFPHVDTDEPWVLAASLSNKVLRRFASAAKPLLADYGIHALENGLAAMSRQIRCGRMREKSEGITVAIALLQDCVSEDDVRNTRSEWRQAYLLLVALCCGAQIACERDAKPVVQLLRRSSRLIEETSEHAYVEGWSFTSPGFK